MVIYVIHKCSNVVVCVCVCARVRACVRACVSACVRVCVCVRERERESPSFFTSVGELLDPTTRQTTTSDFSLACFLSYGGAFIL